MHNISSEADKVPYSHEGAGGELRRLGKTGLSVFPVGFGGCGIGGSHGALGYGPTLDVVSIRAVSKALDLGCNFFDTADVYGYGHSESILGAVLAPRRSKVIIATKVGYDFYHGALRQVFEHAYLDFAVDQSLRRLRTEYVDILQLHNPPAEAALDPRLADAVAALKRTGKVRWLGISAATLSDAEVLVRVPWIDTLQVRYNLLDRKAEETVFPQAASRQIGLIAREPLSNGLLTGKYHAGSRFHECDFRRFWDRATVAQIAEKVSALRIGLRYGETLAQHAIRFDLRYPSVSVVIPGHKDVAQVIENFGAVGIGPHGEPNPVLLTS